MRKLAPLLLFALLGWLACREGFASESVSEAAVEQGSPRKWNLRTNPIGWISGAYGGDVEYALSDHLTLGPTFVWSHNHATIEDADVYETGATLSYYFASRPLEGGWLCRLGIYYFPVKVTRDTASVLYKGSNSGALLDFRGGYQFLFKNGLNFNAAVGFHYLTNPPNVRVTAAGGSTQDIFTVTSRELEPS